MCIVSSRRARRKEKTNGDLAENTDGHGKAKLMNIFLSAMLCGVLLWGCKDKEPVETFTKGSAHIGASDAVFDLAHFTTAQYGDLHTSAFISIWRHSTQALVDSLINGRVEEIFIDRALSHEESLAFTNAGLKLFTYPVAHYPTYLLVPESLAVNDIDSIGLKRIVEGQATSWKEFGGQDISITPYAPLPGDGAWNSLLSFYEDFDSVAAVICSTNSQMMALAAFDPGALLIYSRRTSEVAGYKKLRWAQGELRIPANAKTILESPRWPFMTTFTYVTTHMKSDVAAGYLTFLVSNDGQKMVMSQGYRPASVPVRVIQLQAPTESESDSTAGDSTAMDSTKQDTTF